MAPAQRTVFMATGPRIGQHIRITTDGGVLPDPIALPDPPEGDDETGEGVRDIERVDPGTAGSTTYKLFVVPQGGADCPPMYREVAD